MIYYNPDDVKKAKIKLDGYEISAGRKLKVISSDQSVQILSNNVESNSSRSSFVSCLTICGIPGNESSRTVHDKLIAQLDRRPISILLSNGTATLSF